MPPAIEQPAKEQCCEMDVITAMGILSVVARHETKNGTLQDSSRMPRRRRQVEEEVHLFLVGAHLNVVASDCQSEIKEVDRVRKRTHIPSQYTKF